MEVKVSESVKHKQTLHKTLQKSTKVYGKHSREIGNPPVKIYTRIFRFLLKCQLKYILLFVFFFLITHELLASLWGVFWGLVLFLCVFALNQHA